MALFVAYAFKGLHTLRGNKVLTSVYKASICCFRKLSPHALLLFTLQMLAFQVVTKGSDMPFLYCGNEGGEGGEVKIVDLKVANIACLSSLI